MPLMCVSEPGSEDPWSLEGMMWDRVLGLGLLCWASQVPQWWRICLPVQEMQVWSWSGKIPGEGNGNPLHYSCLGNPMDREAWWATVHGVTRSGTWLSDWTTIIMLLLMGPHMLKLLGLLWAEFPCWPCTPPTSCVFPHVPGYHLRKPRLLTQEELRTRKRRLLQDSCAGEPWGKGAPLQSFSKVIFVWEIVSSHLGWISSRNFCFPSSPSLLSPTFFFKLKYSWFTMLDIFQIYSRMIRSYIHVVLVAK